MMLNLPETADEFVNQYVSSISEDLSPYQAESQLIDYGRKGIIDMVKKHFFGTKQMIMIFGDYSKRPEYFTPDIIDDLVDAVIDRYKLIAAEI